MLNPERLIVDYLRAIPGQKAASEQMLLDAPLQDLIDSIEMIDFLAYLEATLSVTIHDDEVTPKTFETPRSTIAFIKDKLHR